MNVHYQVEKENKENNYSSFAPSYELLVSVKENTDRKRKKNQERKKEKSTDRTQTKMNAPHVMYNVKILPQ